MKPWLIIVLSVLWLVWTPFVLADQPIISRYVQQPPDVDGNEDDEAWSQAVAVNTHDSVANKAIRLKSVHTDQELFFLVQFQDPSEERQHKTLIWNHDLELYQVGPQREDSFVFKWSMEPKPLDLTLTSDQPYRADIWYWKAARTDHAGHADDKMQVYSRHRQNKAKRLLSKNGQLFYLRRMGDKGSAAYETLIHDAFIGHQTSQFKFLQPQGSRADIRAKGDWHAGLWTIEFARKLKTGQIDDLLFKRSEQYRFGVSIYEIAGRKANPKLEKPLFGSGEIGEILTLIFK